MDLYAVSFIDELIGWAVGDNGMILKTINGGIPVELISFSGKVESGKVVLNWETATEINNSSFQIERKIGDTEFTNIGFVPVLVPQQNPKVILSLMKMHKTVFILINLNKLIMTVHLKRSVNWRLTLVIFRRILIWNRIIPILSIL